MKIPTVNFITESTILSAEKRASKLLSKKNGEEIITPWFISKNQASRQNPLALENLAIQKSYAVSHGNPFDSKIGQKFIAVM